MPQHIAERESTEILIYIGYGDKKHSHQEACNLFSDLHPDRPPISRSVVTKIYQRFYKAGRVEDRPNVDRPKIATGLDDNQQLIIGRIVKETRISTNKLFLDCVLGQRSVRRILKSHKANPYKAEFVSELDEEDYERRIEFCEEIKRLINEDPNNLSGILFSDEAI